ncbi:YEATS-associated helix-containing protein, partial [Shewanella marina]|uniref:YEATS-associated helix-containing protein n=1 Tax=Shewanella marina TaxID=487319 RepID=UPI000561693A
SQIITTIAAVIFAVVSIAILTILFTNPNAEVALFSITTPEAKAVDGSSIAMWVHAPFFMMLILGLLGGVLSWLTFDNTSKLFSRICCKHIITGILATFMVPLFLQMIGSGLLDEISNTHKQFYVFLGICSAAAFVAQRFATSISDQLIKDANRKATQAEQKAEEATTKTYEIHIEQLKLQGSMHMIKHEFEEALILMNQYLEYNPKDSNSLCRKAFCLKRVGRIEKALEAINAAIGSLDKPNGIYFFNKACYMTLLDKNIKEIIENLELAILHGGSDVKQAIIKDCDCDLKALLDKPEFISFLKKHNVDLPKQG